MCGRPPPAAEAARLSSSAGAQIDLIEAKVADRLSRRRTAGQVRALRLGPERARSRRDRDCTAPICCCCRSAPPSAGGSAPRLRACGLHAARAAQVLVAVVRAEAPRAAGARAGPASGLAVARRALQRPRCRIIGARIDRCSSRARAAAAVLGRRPPIARPMCRGARAGSSSSRPDGCNAVRARATAHELARLARACGRERAARRSASPSNRAPPQPARAVAQVRRVESVRRLPPGACAMSTGNCARASTGRCSARTARARPAFSSCLYGDLSPALGRADRAPGLPRGTPIAEWKRLVGYVSPELQTDYAVNVTRAGPGGERAATRASDSSMRRRAEDRRVAERWLQILQARCRSADAQAARAVLRPAAPRADRPRAGGRRAHPVAGRAADRSRSHAARPHEAAARAIDDAHA